MSRWMYSRDGEEFGPTDLGGLRQLAKSMHLLPGSRVWQPGKDDGAIASSLGGLQFVTPEAQPDDDRRPGQHIEMDMQYLAEQRRAFVLYALCGTVLVFVLSLFVMIAGSML